MQVALCQRFNALDEAERKQVAKLILPIGGGVTEESAVKCRPPDDTFDQAVLQLDTEATRRFDAQFAG